MLSISYKAVYTLLDKYYARKSLNQVIEGIQHNVFESSKVFAEAAEDYRFLDVMHSKREQLDSEYILFIGDQKLPITLKKNQDVNLAEFSIMAYQNQHIPIREFETVIEAQVENLNGDVAKNITEFHARYAQYKYYIENKCEACEGFGEKEMAGSAQMEACQDCDGTGIKKQQQ